MRRDVVILFLPKTAPNNSGSLLPYTLLYLERMLRDFGLEIILLDESRHPDYSPVLAEKRDRILLAGVSSMTGYQILGGIAFSKQVRRLCAAPVVWGGWHPTLLPEQVLQESYVDYVVVGQGERPLRRLVERFLKGEDVSDIRGLGFKRGGVLSVNPPAPIEDFNSFPPVNWGLLDLNRYVCNIQPHGNRCLTYFASHGCPFHCGFCSVAMVYRRHWFHKPVAQIIAELRLLKQHAGIDSVAFEDDNLFVNADFCRELAQAMIDAKLDLKWKCGAHPRLLAEHFTNVDIELFAESGCWRIYIGAESGDQEVLDVLDKRSKVEQTYRFITMLKPHQIIPRLSTMVCLPMNPHRDFDLTIDMIGRAKLMHPALEATVWFYTPYPGTALYEKAKQKGFVPPQRLEDWEDHTLQVFKAPWAPKGVERQLEYFKECYFRMLDPQAYRRFHRPVLRAIAYPVTKVLFSMAWLRFKTKCYWFPIEAIVFCALLRVYQRKRNDQTLFAGKQV